MPEQVLDHPDIDALFEKVRGKTVPQGVHGNRRIETDNAHGLAASPLNGPHGDRTLRIGSREQQVVRVGGFPIRAQDREQLSDSIT